MTSILLTGTDEIRAKLPTLQDGRPGRSDDPKSRCQLSLGVASRTLKKHRATWRRPRCNVKEEQEAQALRLKLK